MAAKVPSWFWVLLPANAAMSGFGTMAPLYVLKLGGNVLEASAITAVLNLAIVPSMIIWGAVTDRLTGKRLLFTISYLGTAVVFLVMFEAPSIIWLTILSAFLGFVWVANQPAQNLLVMETYEKRSWFRMFATLAFIANIGAVSGLLIGLIWTDLIPLRYFFLFCSASSGLSVLLVSRLIDRSPQVLETKSLLFSPWSAFARVQTTVTVAARTATLVPSKLFSRATLSKAYKTAAVGTQGKIRKLFISSFLFNFGSNFYGGSYVPYLSISHVATSLIFGITLANVVVQTFTYRYVGLVKSWLGEARTGVFSTILMCVCYVGIATSTFILPGAGLISINLAANLAMGFGIAAWSVFNSATVFSELRPESQGGTIGLFSALNSLGVVLGAFLSGVGSLYLGYTFTFGVASIIMISSIIVRRQRSPLTRGQVVPSLQTSSAPGPGPS